jgi:PAS domain S-box-containing protein
LATATNRRLLVVEDDPGLNALLTRKLEQAGFQLEPALTGAAALDSVRRDPNALLLLDYLLPDMTAREVVEKLSANGKDVPFIVMTGHGDEKVAVELMKLGALDYLVKDSDLGETLPEVVRRAFRMVETEERLAGTQAALRVASERLALVQRAARAGAWDWDVVSGHIVWNEEMFLLFGLEPGKSLASFDTWRAVLHADDRVAAEARIMQALEARVPLDNIYRVVRPDGEVRWIEALGQGTYDEAGRPVRMAGICIDITERKQAEQALAKSEERFRQIAENVPDGLVVVEGRLVSFANRRVAEIFGFSLEEIRGMGMLGPIAPDDRPRVLQELRENERRGLTSFGLDFEIVRKDGARRWVQCRYALGLNAGQLPRHYVVITDITERRLAEENLRSLSERQSAILAAVPEIVMEVNTDKVYTWANAVGREFFGDDVIGREAAFYFEGEQDTYERVAPIFAGCDDTVYVESWQRRRDGAKRLLAWWCRTLKDAAGNVTGALSTAQDITERRIIEQKLAESEKRYRLIVETASEGVWTLDADCRTSYVNPRLAALLGCTVEEILGRPTEDFMFPEDVPAFHKRIARRREGESGSYELRLRRQDGSECWALVSASPVLDAAGSYAGSFAMVTDITDRKRVEKELVQHRHHLEELVAERTQELKRIQDSLVTQERLAAIGKVAGSMAHEIRNPLAAIRNAAYFLTNQLGAKLDGKAARHLEIVNQEIDLANGIIASVLDFGRGQPAELLPHNLVDILATARERANLPSGIHVQPAIPYDLPKVQADLQQMVQVFINLLTNASQAMDGSGRVTVTARKIRVEKPKVERSKGQKSVVEVRFRDEGPGIAPNDLPRVFEPLFSTKAVGIGMGLAVCKAFVEAGGGTISVESEPGRGATFIVTLPAVSRE